MLLDALGVRGRPLLGLGLMGEVTISCMAPSRMEFLRAWGCDGASGRVSERREMEEGSCAETGAAALLGTEKIESQTRTVGRKGGRERGTRAAGACKEIGVWRRDADGQRLCEHFLSA